MTLGRLILLVLTLLFVGAEAAAQGRRGERGGGIGELPPNPPYDGRYTFARIRYELSLDGFGGGRFGRDLPWLHDYPRADRNFPQILGEISSIRTRPAQHVILTLTDPELFKYPVAYMVEPGFWRPSAAEIAGLRAYLLKGGFLIFDDFAGRDWVNFENQMRRVLPEHRLVRLTAAHPIFDSFYKIPSLDYVHPIQGLRSEFWGIFEDNDPSKRLIAIANYNNDISEYWEYSGSGFFPIDLSNEAYKIGINYITYALTR